MVQENSESIFHERLGHITESGLTQKSTRVETCLANIVFDQNDQGQTCSCEESRWWDISLSFKGEKMKNPPSPTFPTKFHQK